MRSNILLQAQVQDKAADQVAALFDQYAKPVAVYIQCLVGEAELAYDLTQETFLELFRTRQRLAGVENPRAWIYRIATHLALNELKRRRRFVWLPWNQDRNEPALVWVDLESDAGSREQIERVLAQMTSDYRAALLLFSSYGFSIHEIAETLQINEAAVKTRLHRAREMFRKAYDQERGEP